MYKRNVEQPLPCKDIQILQPLLAIVIVIVFVRIILIINLSSQFIVVIFYKTDNEIMSVNCLFPCSECGAQRRI